jgi:putative ABC transport system ATP-binding protein
MQSGRVGMLIETDSLARAYRIGEHAVWALRDVSLAIEAGEFVVIMGPSGSGKSTLLHILGLLDQPSSGRYRLAGRDTAGLSAGERATLRNREIGIVFQASNLLARNSALENVGLPLAYRGVRAQERRSRAEAALAEVGLAARAGHWPQQLSGGEQQRVAIARALVGGPSLVLADEPTGSVDSAAGEQIMALFRRLHHNGITVVLITHNPGLAQPTDRVLTMLDGRLTESRSGQGARSRPFLALEAAPAWPAAPS